MARTLKDFEANSKQAESESLRRARAVFDQTCTIARQVLELRGKHGMTQVELAEASRVPQSQISRIERGAISPTATTLAKIAAVLGPDLRPGRAAARLIQSAHRPTGDTRTSAVGRGRLAWVISAHSSRRTGNGRTRRRPWANTTIAPASTSPATPGRLAMSIVAC